LQRVIDVRPQELAMVGWSWLFFFCALSAYYVIRPIRDDMGVAGGVQNLAWLFSGTLLGMFLANPPFAYLVARMPRNRFVTASYRFFGANLVLFFFAFLLSTKAQDVWIGRLFFVWTAVFNMFVVSIFWSVMADVFTHSQGKRLFGFIGVGGTLGSIAGSAVTASLVGPLGARNLLLVSVVLLEVGAFAARQLHSGVEIEQGVKGEEAPLHEPEAPLIGGSVWEGFRRALMDPYFVNITLQMLLFTVLTTFLYFEQATIVDATMTDRTVRTQFFARIDLIVNALTLVTQTFATGRLVKTMGLSFALALLPLLSIAGFLLLGFMPTIFVLMAFQVLRRAGNFAIQRPAREVLFTVVSREDRYKTKSFIDTFVYRAGDQIGAWAYAPLAALGLGAGAAGITSVATVLAVISVVNAVWLGSRAQDASRSLPTRGTSELLP
jgi:AAA family ATP:ADP antiporter